MQQGRADRARGEAAAAAAEQEASQARRRAAVAADEARRRGVSRGASLRARMARSGVGSEGTALDVLGQAAAEAELEALQAFQQGEEAAFGRLLRAGDRRAAARTASRRANLRAGSQLLRGGANFGRAIR